MIRFRALGGVDLRGPDGEEILSILARPKLLALLSYLAFDQPRTFTRRDSLLPLLWNDLDQDRGRRALRQALYHLRRALGEGAIVVRGDDEIGLSPGAIQCDVDDFERAIEEGALDRAEELYRGPLLDGFNLPSSEQFERWLDERRAQLRLTAREISWQLAERAEAAGDGVEAARRAVRAMRLDPLDEHTASDAIQLLDRIGNRSGALREYESFAQRMREELGIEPSPDTRALAEAIRSRRAPATDPNVPREAGHAEAAVTKTEAPKAMDAKTERAATVVQVPPSHRHGPDLRRRRRTRWAAGGAIVAVATALWLWKGPADEGSVPAGGADPSSIAVLPFENLAGDPTAEALVRGIHEDILTGLYKVAGLTPISRTSVMEYRDSDKNLRQIAAELGVARVLEGGVQKSANRVRIHVQLIDAATDEHLWAEVYERELTLENMFAVQAEVARHVAVALRAQLSDEERQRLAHVPTGSSEAYEAYLTARDYRRRWRVGEEERRIARDMYRKAIELAPEFALARAELSEFLSRVCWIYGCEEGSYDEAEALASEALALEPDLAEAYLARGNLAYYAREDFAAAVESFRRAIELAPGDSEGYAKLAAVQARLARPEEARDNAVTAARLSPREPDRFDFLGYTLLWLHDYDGAIRAFERASSLAPDVVFSHYWRTWAVLARDGDVRRAHDSWQRGRESVGATFVPLSIDYHGRALVRILEIDDPPPPEGAHGILVASHWISRALRLQSAGDTAAARAYFDSARVSLEAGRVSLSEEYRRAALGTVYAELGDSAQAVREGSRAIELVPMSADVLRATWFELALAETGVLLGDPDAALDRLEKLMRGPGPLTAAVLEADPVWDPLRRDPRWARLLRPKP